MSTEALAEQTAQRVAFARTHLPGDHTFPVGSAAGAFVLLDAGRPHLDFATGGEVNILGHCPPGLTAEIWRHCHWLTYGGEDMADASSVHYAEKLAARFDEPRQVLVVPSVADAWSVVRTITGGEFLLLDRLWLTTEPNACVVADETRTGFGRTGRLWGYQHGSTTPHVVVLGPAGGGGLPYAAVVAPPELFEGFSNLPPMSCHPLVSAVATWVLDHLTDDLLAHVRTMSEVLHGGIGELAGQFPAVIRGSSGVGLRQKLSINETSRTQEFRAACRSEGLLLHPDLVMTPPLTVTEQEVVHAVDILAAVCLDWEE